MAQPTNDDKTPEPPTADATTPLPDDLNAYTLPGQAQDQDELEEDDMSAVVGALAAAEGVGAVEGDVNGDFNALTRASNSNTNSANGSAQPSAGPSSNGNGNGQTSRQSPINSNSNSNPTSNTHTPQLGDLPRENPSAQQSNSGKSGDGDIDMGEGGADGEDDEQTVQTLAQPLTPGSGSLRQSAFMDQITVHGQIMLVQRKQNIACDTCRGRKVKCVRQPGAEKCDHCTLKDLSCTSHYVTQLATARKNKASEEAVDSGSGSARPTKKPRKSLGPSGNDATGTPDPLKSSQHTHQLNALLSYLLAPYPVLGGASHWKDPSSIEMAEMPWAPTFLGGPSAPHLALNSVDARKDLASDLLETYFQIVHIRMPLIEPASFRRQFLDPDGPDGPPNGPLLAVVLAWGAKFSEHSAILKDRTECSTGLAAPRQRSRLVQVMAVRAQQVAEVEKVFRVASLENIQTCLMINVLQGGNVRKPDKFDGSWIRHAAAHLIALRYHKKSVVQAIPDVRLRASTAFTFWMTVWCDGFCSAFYRHKPSLLDGDWNVEPEQAWTAASESTLNPMPALEEFLLWHTSITGMCHVSRQIAAYMWQPDNEIKGVELANIRKSVQMLTAWRNEFLDRVGVPTVWPETWNFIAAVTACTSDADYHCLWIHLAVAVKKWNIRELKQIHIGERFASPAEEKAIREEAEALRKRIMQEALHGALRISALSGVLAQNSYLRLDPNIMFATIYEAGVYLAESGRMEVQAVITGLRQCGLVFEECFDRADELQALYDRASQNSSQDSNVREQTRPRPIQTARQAQPAPLAYNFPPPMPPLPVGADATADFNYITPAALPPSSDLYPLPDPQAMTQMFYHSRS